MFEMVKVTIDHLLGNISVIRKTAMGINGLDSVGNLRDAKSCQVILVV